jgi:hypothetical protein
MTSKYRYLLSRDLAESSSKVLVVSMLNPSTADETNDDPTVLSVCRLARNAGFAKVKVLNLFAIRATNPKDMWLHSSPTGENNWKTWTETLQNLNPKEDAVVLAWGRAPTVYQHRLKFIQNVQNASQCLKKWDETLMTWINNKDGSPRHPLYISSNTKLRPYNLDDYISLLLSSNNKN